MILKSIHIKNYRAYKDFECDFDNGINLVIGDNGAGKTSLLAAITQLLSIQMNEFGGALPLNPTDPYVEVQNAGDATMSIMENYPVILSGNMRDHSGEEYDFKIEYDSLISRRDRGRKSA